MSNEMAVYDASTELQVSRPPAQVLSEAMIAASALKDVVSKKAKPVMFNGEQYLEFEDWQTIARFYGLTAKVTSTNIVDFGGVIGFEANAVAIRADGAEVSAADAMCLNDEPNWKSKPLFQLRSMAQTRACAKALRNVLAWVVVLAGYRPTPAEEIKDMANSGKPSVQQPQEKGAASTGPVISEAQSKRLYAISKSKGWTEEGIKELLAEHGFKSSKEVTKAKYEEICKEIEGGQKAVAAEVVNDGDPGALPY